MCGLDEIENVFPREVENGAHDAEAAQATPEGASGGRVRVRAQVPKTEADRRAATGRHEIRNGNAQIDQQPKHDERRGLRHQSDRSDQTEIPHRSPAPFSGNVRMTTTCTIISAQIRKRNRAGAVGTRFVHASWIAVLSRSCRRRCSSARRSPAGGYRGSTASVCGAIVRENTSTIAHVPRRPSASTAMLPENPPVVSRK